MKPTLGNDTPSKTRIYKWFKEFSGTSKNLSDDAQGGRLSSTVQHEHLDAVRNLIASDRDVKYDKIETSLNISRIRMHSTVHNDLNTGWLQKSRKKAP